MPTRFQRLTNLVLRHDSMVRASKPMAELQVLIMAGVLVNYFRFYIDEDGLGNRKFFPSLLVLLNAPSGAGKNGGLSFMRNSIFRMAVDNMILRCEDDFERWRKEKVKLIEASVEKEFEGKTGKKVEEDKGKEISKRSKKLYNKKRTFTVLEEPQGSYEGFAFDRAYMSQLKWGAPSFFSAEYGSKLLLSKKQSYLQALYDSLFELIDRDNLSPKSVKDKQGETPSSKGVGLTLYLTFSALNPGQINDVKQTILQTAGRRGLILREASKELATAMTHKEPLSEGEVEEMENEINELFDVLEECTNRCIPFGEGAREYYKGMRKRSVDKWKHLGITLPEGEHKEIVLALNTDLARRALKLATLLAIINHGESSISIEVEDLKRGEALAGYFLERGRDFFSVGGGQAYAVFKESVLNNKRGYITAKDVAALKIPGLFFKSTYQEEVKKFLMGDLQEEAQEDGFVIEHFKNKKQDRYRLVEMDEDDKFLEGIEDVKPNEEVTVEEMKYLFSYREDLNEKVATGYKVKEGEPFEIINAVRSATSYGASEWKGGHRMNKNFIRANLIILDYDEGLTLEEAKGLFINHRCIIATTKSHQIEKNGEVCDRFRVILFMNRTITSGTEFMDVMNYMTTKFKADKCKDAGRFYYGCVGSKVQRVVLGKTINVDKILVKVVSQVKKYKPLGVEYGVGGTIGSMLIDINGRGDKRDAYTYIGGLPQDDSTHAICCPFHDDKNPSAFASHNANGGLQITCSGCDRTEYIKK